MRISSVYTFRSFSSTFSKMLTFLPCYFRDSSSAQDKAAVVFAEAVTSKGERVIVSTGEPGYIGRSSDESYPATEFHLLDVRYKFPHWQLNRYSGVGTAIDEEGEVWVLCSGQETNFFKLDPSYSEDSADDKN